MSYGHAKNLVEQQGSNTAGTFPATAVPLELLQQVRKYPIPVTVGGSNNVTFTLKGSTQPIPIWSGREYIELKEDLAYTWGAVSNAILDSNGANATDADSVLGVWYMYAAINWSADPPTYELRPSQTAPSYVSEGPYNGGILGHPGTSRARLWQYVGFMVCTTAATPAFRAMVKHGYWWKFAPVSFVVITDAWTAPTNATLHIPKLADYGMEIKGTLETGADGQIFIGAHTASTIWDAELDISEATASNVAQQILQAPVIFSPNDSASPFYAIAAPAGDFHLLGIKDVL